MTTRTRTPAPANAPFEIVGTVERAFQLAQSGGCRSIDEVRSKLKQEGCEAVDRHLAGPSLRRELGRLCQDAAPPADAAIG